MSICVVIMSRLLTSLHHTKEEERLGFLVVLVSEKLCLSWDLSTMFLKPMVCLCSHLKTVFKSDMRERDGEVQEKEGEKEEKREKKKKKKKNSCFIFQKYH